MTEIINETSASFHSKVRGNEKNAATQIAHQEANKRLARKKRRATGTRDSFGKAPEKTADRRPGPEKDPLAQQKSPPPFSHNGNGSDYYPGESLMAYALQAMLLDINGGLSVLKAVGESQMEIFKEIGAAYDKLAQSQEKQYKAQAAQATWGAIASGVGALISFATTAYGAKKWGTSEAKLKKLNGNQKELEGLNSKTGTGKITKMTNDSKSAEMKNTNKEGEVTVKQVNKPIKQLREDRTEILDPKNKYTDEQKTYKLKQAEDRIATREAEIVDVKSQIEDEKSSTRQMQNTVQNIGYFGNSLTQTGTKASEAVFITQIGAAQVSQTQANKLKEQGNMVYQAAEQIYNRVAANLDQDFSQLASAAQAAEAMKQRGAAA